jgi:hypothetical protein
MWRESLTAAGTAAAGARGSRRRMGSHAAPDRPHEPIDFAGLSAAVRRAAAAVRRPEDAEALADQLWWIAGEIQRTALLLRVRQVRLTAERRSRGGAST